ncbi:hypothetical protein EVAR_27831_1 [Eumeta japonica]|uniref:Uncharacterized protein n=1 Tax=Eumeta variegata TaxID=151549 RepID=A0A4C1VL98_EUMVA|nr:hypothetical protein EVAR_27831_1 [Eumeta japonica]
MGRTALMSSSVVAVGRPSRRSSRIQRYERPLIERCAVRPRRGRWPVTKRLRDYNPLRPAALLYRYNAR